WVDVERGDFGLGGAVRAAEPRERLGGTHGTPRGPSREQEAAEEPGAVRAVRGQRQDDSPTLLRTHLSHFSHSTEIIGIVAHIHRYASSPSSNRHNSSA